MSVPSNTFKTYETVGVREDLSDLIKVISPVDTMFYSGLSEGGAKQTKVEWQSDALAASAENAALEGDDETAEAVAPTTRLSNMCQIQKKVFRLSNTQEEVVKAGRSSEKDYQTAKKGKELSKDVEYAFLKGVLAAGDADNARKMKGILNWVVTNLNKASDATLNADGTVSGGTDRDFTESLFKTVLQNIFVAGGNPSLCYTTPTLKGVMSGWVQASGTNYKTDVSNKTQNAAVDVYVSDFGTVSIKPHRDMLAKTALVLDPSHKGKKGTLRNTHRQQLAITGDNQQWVIRAEHTLRDIAEAAHGRLTNLK